MKDKIFLYYTSDLHSHFENWPKIVGYFNHQIKKHVRNDDSYWLLDNGDHVDRFHPIAEGLMGKGNVELLNQAGYHLANLGNNEGITLSHDNLYSLYDGAQFDIVCANLRRGKEPQPDWLQPYKIITSKQGTKIGVIGLTAPFKAFYQQIGWEVTLPYEALSDLLETVQKEADIIVILSHLGINDDEEIARRYSGIDVIIGGHTHHLFQNGEYIDQSLLTASGKHGTHLGEIVLEWDTVTHSLIRKEAYAVPTEKLTESKPVVKQVQSIREEAVLNLQTSIARLKEPQYIAWFQETPLMRQLTEELLTWTGAEIAMLNAGVLLDHLESGEITYEDVHRICPHPMNPCKVELTGDEILEVIRVAHTSKLTEFKLKGLGFRGEIIGKMIFAGVEIELVEGANGDSYVRQVRFHGEPLVKDQVYSFATADTFTFGRLFPEIAYSRSKKYYMPELLRDLLAEALRSV